MIVQKVRESHFLMSEGEYVKLDAATMLFLRWHQSGSNRKTLQILLGQSEVKNWLRSTPVNMFA